MSDDKDLKQRILEEAPRFGLDDKFQFACHPGVPCFNDCCRDINIVLTPYCVIRLKNRLQIRSGAFLDEYAIVPFNKDMKQPVPILKMGDDENKACPFVGPEGCTVYEDRPWACRMYPVGLASPRDIGQQGEPFYFLLEEGHCKGFAEQGEFTIREWIEDQGIAEYNEMGELFKPVSLHPFFDSGDLSPAKMDMFFMVAYDQDRFRRFIFGSTFLEKFVVPQERIDAIRTDDVALMKFGFDWIRFALFQEPTMQLQGMYTDVQKRERDFFQQLKEADPNNGNQDE